MTPASCACTVATSGICDRDDCPVPTPEQRLRWARWLYLNGHISDWPAEPVAATSHQSAPDGRRGPPLYGVGFWASWALTAAGWALVLAVTWGKS